MTKKKIIIIIAAVAVVGIVIAAVALLGGDKEPPPVVFATYSPGDSFVLNTSDGKALFKCGMMLVIDSAFSAQMDENALLAYSIRDCVLLTLRGISLDELQDINALAQIKKKIVGDLNNFMGDAYEAQVFYDVYFSDFVLQ